MTKACPPTHHRQLGARNHFLNDRPAQQLRAQNESDDNPAWIATRSEPATSVPIEEARMATPWATGVYVQRRPATPAR